MEPFCVTMTATLRPKLIKQTLDSHIELLFKDVIHFARLIINIDCIGCEEGKHQETLHEIVDLVKTYPFRDITMQASVECNFAKAWFWTISEVSTPFFFNLEDDWTLEMNLNFKDMFKLMQSDKSIAQLRLSAFRSTEETLKNWNRFLQWNGRFFEVIDKDKLLIGWCGHPSLNSTKFIKNLLPYMDKERNPEKQIKGRRGYHRINEILRSCRFGVYHAPNSPSAIKDMGRKWMIENGFAKKGTKAFFTQWERTK